MNVTFQKRLRSAAWSVVVTVCFYAAHAPAADTPNNTTTRTNEVKPFLSGVTAVAVDDWSKSLTGEWRHWAFPTNTEVRDPFHDQSFALNIPFEVPFPGGPAGAWFHVQFVWNDAEAEHFKQFPLGVSNVVLEPFGQGVYRLDHAELPEGMKSAAVPYLMAHNDGRWRATSPDFTALMPVSGAPFPMSVALKKFDHAPPNLAPFGFRLRTDKLREPFLVGDFRHYEGQPEATSWVSFPSARPGWYVHWMTLRLGIEATSMRGSARFWPRQRVQADDTLRGRFVIRYIVAPRDPYNSGLHLAEVLALFKNPAAPTNVVSPESLRRFEARTVELPVTFRRNGWVFDHVEVQVNGTNAAAWLAHNQLSTPPGDQNREAHVVTSDIKITVNKTELKLRSASHVPLPFNPTRWRGPEPQTDIRRHWALTFPEQIPDQGVSLLTANVGFERKGDYTFDNPHHPYGLENGNAARFLEGYIAPGAPLHVAARRSGLLPAPWTIAWQIVRAGGTREAYIAGTSHYLNDPQAEWWRPVPVKPTNGPVEIPYAAPSGPWTDFFNFTNGGARAVMALECGPWIVDGYYRRKSELERLGELTVRDPGTRISETDDDFSPWLVEFHDLRERAQEKAQTVGVGLGIMRDQIRTEHKKWQTLMRLDLQAFHIGKGDLVDSVHSLYGDNALGRAVSGGRAPVRPTAQTHIFEDLKRQREEIAPRINQLLIRQAALIRESVDAYDVMISRARVKTVGCREHPEHLKDLNRMIEDWEGKRDLHRLKLYESAGLYSAPELPKIIADLRFSGDATRELAKLLEARVGLDRADALQRRLTQQILSPNPVAPGSPVEQQATAARIAAMNSLREVLALNPNSMQAQALLREIELEMLGWLAAKLDRERESSMAAFRDYLKQRGYYSDQPDGWCQDVFEWGWIMWGNAITTIGAGFPTLIGTNQVTARAELTGDTQFKVARNQVSLLAIRRLVRNGQTLRQVRELKPEKLGEVMVLNTAKGEPLPPAKMAALAQDIRDTFADMPELRALAEGDAGEFNEFVNRNLYKSFDTRKTGWETIGDMFFSPGSLALFLGPSAVVKVDGAWVWSSHGFTSAEIGVLSEAAKTKTVRDLYSAGLSLEKTGELLKNPEDVGWLARAVAADQALLASRVGYSGSLERFLTGGSRLGAAVVLYGGVAHLADEYELPALRILVDAIGALGTEELAYEILARRAGPLKQLLGKVDDFSLALAREERELAELANFAQRLEALEQKIAVERMATPARVKEIDQVLEQAAAAEAAAFRSRRGSASRPLAPHSLPGLNRKDDSFALLRKSASALKNTNNKEARAALDAAKNLRRELDAKITGYHQALARARANLNRKPLLRQIEISAPMPAMRSVDVPENFIPKEYPKGNVGNYVRFGDEALISGRVDEAMDLYRKAHELAQVWSPPKDHLLIESRLGFVAELKSRMDYLTDLRRGQPLINQAVSKPILAAEYSEVVRALKAGELILDGPLGTKNPVFRVRRVGPDSKVEFYFKQISDQEDIACEIFGSLAASHLKLNPAGAERAKFVARRNVNGTMVEEEVSGLLVRAIETGEKGGELFKMTEAAALAHKEEYAALRVFRAWIGDTDGHFGNIFVGAEGRLHPLDFGYAHLLKDAKKHRQFHDMDARTPEQFLAEVIEQPRLMLGIAQHGGVKSQAQAWIGHMDEFLTYDEMAGTVKAIRDLCQDRDGATLKEMLRESMRGLPEDRVDEAFRVLTDRADELEEVLRWKFPNRRTPTASLFHNGRIPQFRVPAPIHNSADELAFAA